MAKQRTTWLKEGQTDPTAGYNDSTITYDSATQQYGGNGQSPASGIKQRTDWTKDTKQRTAFEINPASTANDRTYNQAGITYNQIGLTYSGITAGEPRATNKKPTEWSKE